VGSVGMIRNTMRGVVVDQRQNRIEIIRACAQRSLNQTVRAPGGGACMRHIGYERNDHALVQRSVRDEGLCKCGDQATPVFHGDPDDIPSMCCGPLQSSRARRP